MQQLAVEELQGAVAFDILVVPRASRARVGPLVGDRLKVSVTAPPVEGEANAALEQTLARALGVRRQDVTIVGGQRSRRKRVLVKGIGRAELLARLGKEP
jgi:uncharacterized protein (TIGR00251 family)